MKPISEVFHGDCMAFMAGLPDGYFELAVVDPPYGIGIIEKTKAFSGKTSKYKNKEWDNNPPDAAYFTELFRVSKNQIIWGGNYFINHLYPTKCVIFWDKWNSNKGKFADGELAWTSFDSPTRLITLPWLRYFQPNMANKQKRIHPTQKPYQLYEFCLNTYAKPGDKILDTHLGSQSSRIAAYKLGFDFWGCEIDNDYIREGNARFEKEIAMPLFDAPKPVIQNQLNFETL